MLGSEKGSAGAPLNVMQSIFKSALCTIGQGFSHDGAAKEVDL